MRAFFWRARRSPRRFWGEPMTSMILACLWVITAHVIALTPTRDYHWRAAYVLIAIGLPILGFVFWENGIWLGLIVLAAAMSILRWPVIYLWRWIKSVAGRGDAQ